MHEPISDVPNTSVRMCIFPNSANVAAIAVTVEIKIESSEKTIVVDLDSRHTAILSKKYDENEISIAVLDGKYNDYCTKEVFTKYNQDIIRCETYEEAKRLIKDMLMIFKR